MSSVRGFLLLLCVSGLARKAFASCTDGAENDDETDVDCGGPLCPPCEPAQKCCQDTDCEGSETCVGSSCAARAVPDVVRLQGRRHLLALRVPAPKHSTVIGRRLYNTVTNMAKVNMFNSQPVMMLQSTFLDWTPWFS